jgi:hypothetical protein
MEVGRMEVPKEIDRSHNVFENNIPTTLVEGTRKTVRSGGLVPRK